jgi:hypothetical protein
MIEKTKYNHRATENTEKKENSNSLALIYTDDL